MALPAFPPDLSGGYMLLGAKNSVTGRRHHLHLHVVDFDETFAYTPNGALDQPATSVAGLADTWDAFKAIWKTFYDDNWTLSFRRLYKVIHADATVNGVPRKAGVPFRIPRPIGLASQAGEGGDPTEGIQDATASIYNIPSLKGGRFRLMLIGAGGVDPGVNVDVIGDSAGNSAEKLVAFLAGGVGNGNCARDGGGLDAEANLTIKDLNVLRRKYEFDRL